MEAYHIIWNDACTEGGWLSLDEATCATLTITTIGWLVTSSDRTITVCQSVDDHGQTAERITIPRACIVQLTRLGVTPVTEKGNETGVVTV